MNTAFFTFLFEFFILFASYTAYSYGGASVCRLVTLVGLIACLPLVVKTIIDLVKDGNEK